AAPSIEGRGPGISAELSRQQQPPDFHSQLAPLASMDGKALALVTCLLLALSPSDEKPVSLTYRCPCRFYESNVAKANIKHLKILTTPNCSVQIVARLKNNSKQVCIDPKLKWIQEYLEKALNKRFKM
ncbi:C-X-C motif chemokine ligand 12, partial [Chelydra serpentina]